MSKVQIHLTLIGNEFDTEKVSEILGINPQYVRQKNELLGNGRCFGHTEWGISSNIETDDSLHSALSFFFQRLENKIDLMREIAVANDANWHLLFEVDVIDKSFPVTYIDSNQIDIIHRLNASMGFDVLML